MVSFSSTKILVFLGVAFTHASLIGSLSCLGNSKFSPEEEFIFLELVEPEKPELLPEEDSVKSGNGNTPDEIPEEAVEPEENTIESAPPPPVLALPDYQLETSHDSASGSDGLVRGDAPDAGEQVAEEETRQEEPSVPAKSDALLPAKENTAKELGKQGEKTATREGKFGSGGNGGDSLTATVRYQRRVAPKYPRADRIAGRTGTVILILEIDANGELTDVRIKQSSGSRSLDAAAIRAARASRYLPAHDGERAVPSRAEASYTFSR